MQISWDEKSKEKQFKRIKKYFNNAFNKKQNKIILMIEHIDYLSYTVKDEIKIENIAKHNGYDVFDEKVFHNKSIYTFVILSKT